MYKTQIKRMLQTSDTGFPTDEATLALSVEKVFKSNSNTNSNKRLFSCEISRRSFHDCWRLFCSLSHVTVKRCHIFPVNSARLSPLATSWVQTTTTTTTTIFVLQSPAPSPVSVMVHRQPCTPPHPLSSFRLQTEIGKDSADPLRGCSRTAPTNRSPSRRLLFRIRKRSNAAAIPV